MRSQSNQKRKDARREQRKAEKTQRKAFRIRLAVILAAVLLIIGVCTGYVCDYNRADPDVLASFAQHYDYVTVTDLGDGKTAYGSADAKIGLIFYPGGKVEHTAYEPLMRALAARGVLCVLVKMPLKLAVLDINAADGVQEQFPGVKSWYIGGHSLGGSMAASYAAEHADSYDGLILLASYSTADLSDTDLKVLSLYGSEDGVLNLKKYEKYKQNLPADLKEIKMPGGNHAQFGAYGTQRGDGTATLDHTNQIELTVTYILSLGMGIVGTSK